MKQLPMTPELEGLIKAAVGVDVETDGFAVFEAIAINTLPLIGKDGTIFEKATVMPITLQQMADSLADGKHIPLISDHQLMGEPKGRAFHGELNYDSERGELELRVLFYLDPTETVLTEKLNAGSLDEVSVSFLSTELLCSECGWDYFGLEAESSNFYDRICANGHKIGEDGVHVQLVGLKRFVELSLVARGAAVRPRILGKSQSKLLPASSMRLAAKGFEIDRLICQASLGEEVLMDTTKLMSDLVDAKTSVAVLTTEKSNMTVELSASQTSLTAAEASVASLTVELAAAKAVPNNEADYQVALAFLGEVLTKVLVASGVDAPAELPKTVAELTAAIEEKTAKLTAILPVGGVAAAAGAAAADDAKSAFHASAFSNRKLGK